MKNRVEDNPGIVLYAKKTLALLIGIVITALGACFAIKAAAGISAWDAMALTLSQITGAMVGSVAIAFNASCILVQLLIEKRKFKPIQFLQFFNVLVNGLVLNLLTYYVFQNLVITSYPLRLLVLAAAYVVSAFGITVIMEVNLVRNPLEGVCQLIGEKINRPMGKVRMLSDILFIAIAVGLALLFRLPVNIREGTVICMLILGPMMDLFKKPVRNILDRIHV